MPGEILLQALRHVWRTLEPLNVPVAVIGGIAVLACEDLVLHKLLAGRMIDLADAVALLRANRDTLDLNYLSCWAGKLAVEAELVGVRKEAFPEGRNA